jgi:para-nitrobenzyl esterase
LGLLAIVVVATAVLPGSAAANRPDGAPVARTQSGVVRGFSADGVDNFRGVPFAEPPVAALRWQPPRPARPWSGVRAAVDYGPVCAQPASPFAPRVETEDCLYLNVQRPAGVRQDQRLPVYVWIHGGALISGSGSQYDGTRIVRDERVVVVTINYRLGLLGFLAHPALTAEAGQSGNYGFMDQQAALRWVQRNIARFGGDPRRVTIGGESAGGWSICGHLVAPGSRGLFARAMIQSGSCPSQSLASAEAQGGTFAQSVGCADPVTAAGCLRGAAVGALLDQAPDVALFVHGVPVFPQPLRAAVDSGDFARVPVVNGATRDEGRLFTTEFIGYTQQQYTDWVNATFAEAATAVLARYPWPADADQFTPAYLIAAIITDSGFLEGIGGCGNRALTKAMARHTTVYAYRFDNRDGPSLIPVPGYVAGAEHAAELMYLWSSFDTSGFGPDDRELADNMTQYWGSFIRGGPPSAARSARWPSFNRAQQTLSLRPGGASTLLSDDRIAAEHQCEFWDGALTR